MMCTNFFFFMRVHTLKNYAFNFECLLTQKADLWISHIKGIEVTVFNKFATFFLNMVSK